VEDDADTVVVDSTLTVYVEPDEPINENYYAITLTSNLPAKGTIDPSGEIGMVYLNTDGKYVATFTGVEAAAAVVVTAELKTVSYVNGVRTLTAIDPAVTDTVSIAVTAE
jgi:hypothetical protein